MFSLETGLCFPALSCSEWLQIIAYLSTGNGWGDSLVLLFLWRVLLLFIQVGCLHPHCKLSFLEKPNASWVCSGWPQFAQHVCGWRFSEPQAGLSQRRWDFPPLAFQNTSHSPMAVMAATSGLCIFFLGWKNISGALSVGFPQALCVWSMPWCFKQ